MKTIADKIFDLAEIISLADEQKLKDCGIQSLELLMTINKNGTKKRCSIKVGNKEDIFAELIFEIARLFPFYGLPKKEFLELVDGGVEVVIEGTEERKNHG